MFNSCSDIFDLVVKNVSEYYSSEFGLELEIVRISEVVLEKWKESWETVNNRLPPNGGWDWAYKVNDFKNSFKPKLILDIAILDKNKKLCGLALCRKSKNNEHIVIHFIEGSPEKNHSLRGRIFDIVDAVCLQYADILKMKKIIIFDPVEGLIEFYKSRDYLLNKKSFCGSRCLEKGV